MARSYPLVIDDQRNLPVDYKGPIHVWDVDKTYLSTRFSSFKGLARIPLEFAVDKKAIPGMPEVLRGLRKGPGTEVSCIPLFFVSASPVQLRGVLEHRMLLDGVEYDGIILKNWVKTFLELRPGRLKENLGYKLNALLRGRMHYPGAEEYLFGDDVENDALSFYLYSRLLAGKIDLDELDELLADEGVKKDDRLLVQRAIEDLPDKRGRVKRAYIHLQKRTPPKEFKRFGRLVVPVLGAYQLSLALYEIGLIGKDSVERTLRAVASGLREGDESIDRRIDDALSRGLISDRKYKEIKFEP